MKSYVEEIIDTLFGKGDLSIIGIGKEYCKV